MYKTLYIMVTLDKGYITGMTWCVRPAQEDAGVTTRRTLSYWSQGRIPAGSQAVAA